MVSGKKAMRRSVSFFIFSGGAARAVFQFQGGRSAERMKTNLSQRKTACAVQQGAESE